MKFKSKHKIFYQENTFQNIVCKMAAILFWPPCIRSDLWCNFLASVSNAIFLIIWDNFITISNYRPINTQRLRQIGRHFPDNIFKWIFFDANVWIFIKMSLKFVPQGPTNNMPALVQIMAWCWPGDKPLSEPMIISWLMHICVTWPQWVKS